MSGGEEDFDPPTVSEINGKGSHKLDDGTEAFIKKELGEASICAKIDDIGWLSFISFAWVFDYLWKAFRGKVDQPTSLSCSIFDSANVNMTRLEIMWKEELKTKPDAPSLFRVILRFMKYRLIFACFIFSLCLIFGFIGPTCLVRGLIAFVEKPARNPDGTVDYFSGAVIVGIMFIVEISRVLLYGACWAVSYRTGIRVRGAVLALMYKHLMNSRSLRNMTPAEIVNVCANDGQRLFDAVTFAPLVLIGPFVLVGGLGFLLKVIGWPSIAGILVFIVFDVIQAALGITMVRFRKRAIAKTEARMNLMGEVIRSVRIIKMNAWENLFVNRITKLRAEEQQCLKVAGYAQSLAIASGTIVPVVATIATVLVIVAVGSDLKASDAFAAITVFFVMLFGIRMIPYGSRYLAEALQSVRKIQAMLLSPTFDPAIPMPRTRDIAIQMKNARFVWDIVEPEKADKPESTENGTTENGTAPNTDEEATLLEQTPRPDFALDQINLTINRGELIGICGSVGSGKTSLLHAIVGQLIPESGDFALGGGAVLAAQVPIILNQTVRDNILFGLPMNTQRYYRAIQAAQLSKDLEAMPKNEQTEVGERGVTLSGGQRARISLARTLYATKDVYLLDDVFSSIDKNVADKIFANAVKDFLSDKTVLLVTSDAEYLAQCDRIVYMSEGRIAGIDTHEKLIGENDGYKEFFEHYIQPTQYASRVSSPDGEKPVIEDVNEEKETTGSTDKLADDEEDYGLANVSKSIYAEYILAAGGFAIFSVVIAAFIINVASGIFSTYWLSKWMNDVHKDVKAPNGTVYAQTFANQPDLSFYVIVYTVSLFVLFFTGLFKAMMFVKVSLQASTNLHNRMLTTVMYALTNFFDITPTGRILNRFSKDMDEIDVKLPFSAEAMLQNVIICVGFLAMIAWVFPAFLIASLPLFGTFALFFLCFRAGIRSLKRTENISRSPLFSHVSSSLEGLVTIHSFAQTPRFIDGFKTKLDEHSGALFLFQSAMRWQAVWLDLLVVAVTIIVSTFIVLFCGTITPADAGMALAFALQMSGVFQFAVRSQTELESKLTAVERVSYYYKNIEGEDSTEDPTIQPPKDWPSNGDIAFQNVTMRYRRDATPALDDVSFEIDSGDKVGVVGRTGSGKSSLANALFRMYPLESGKITVAKLDTAGIDVHALRRAMAIIPQDPILFAGTLRFNLDPEEKKTDDELWAYLDGCGLKDTVQTLPEKLDFKLEATGSNLSAGQKQMICVCRALLKNAQIIVLDEATANLDSATDKLIQECIREKSAGKTLLLITHRLGNVADMDKIVTVEDAKLKIENKRGASEPLYPILAPPTPTTKESSEPAPEEPTPTTTINEPEPSESESPKSE
uniref:Multidrug resistance-associated protein 5 n=1 Tax=Panagrellus redivivus TaxID=6233 RepID=A0A7E4VUH3_PANRE